MVKRGRKEHGFLLHMTKHGNQFEKPYWAVQTPQIPSATQWARLGLLIDTTGELHPNIAPNLEKTTEYIDNHLKENNTSYNQLSNYGVRDLVGKTLRLWNGTSVVDARQTLVSLDIAYLGKDYRDDFLEKISHPRMISEEGRKVFEFGVPHPFAMFRLRHHKGIIANCLEEKFGVKIPVLGTEPAGQSLYTLS